MRIHHIEIVGSVVFALAILHCFLTSAFQRLANRYPSGSVMENFFHLLGEVEVVFGFWAGVLLLWMSFSLGQDEAVHYVESLNFSEPAFVFVVMVICSTRPIMHGAYELIETLSKCLPLPHAMAFFVTTLTIGPLLGSFITEPAAMTVTALLLRDFLFNRDVPSKVKYAVIATLFVNISIGGVLTSYAAPPVLMVAGKWQWGLKFMFANFGWKAVVAIVVNTSLLAILFRKDIQKLPRIHSTTEKPLPFWIILVHLLFLGMIVYESHHMTVFTGLFLFFLGVVTITQEYQIPLKLRESLLVGFFLAGLVIFGKLQAWWLRPLLENLTTSGLYFGGTLLTGFIDNAALTYLGSQVPNLSDMQKYALVAGAVTGGGLTVIANAPNPAGFSILQSTFGASGIEPIKLFCYALPPTIVAALCFWGTSF